MNNISIEKINSFLLEKIGCDFKHIDLEKINGI